MKKQNLIPGQRPSINEDYVFFGHIARLDENAPAKLALYEAIRVTKHPRGRQKTTLLKTIQKQLQDLCGKDFYEAIELAQDRKVW